MWIATATTEFAMPFEVESTIVEDDVDAISAPSILLDAGALSRIGNVMKSLSRVIQCDERDASLLLILHLFEDESPVRMFQVSHLEIFDRYSDDVSTTRDLTIRSRDMRIAESRALESCARDARLNAAWVRFVRAVGQVRTSDGLAELERLAIFDRVTVAIDDEYFRRKRVDGDSAHASLTLFFQWFWLANVYPLANLDETCFVWDTERNAVKICLDVDAVCENDVPRGAEVTNLNEKENASSGDVDFLTPTTSKSFAGGNKINLTSGNHFDVGNETFVITDGERYLHVYSRPARRNVDVITVNSRRSVSRSFKRRAPSSAFDERQRDDDDSNSTRVTTLTPEQRRVMSVIERHVFTSVSPASLPTRRRVLIDGVAGCGKTFIMGALLNSSISSSIVYLAKTKYFVQSVQNRFDNDARLATFTIDAFLMRLLGIRNLRNWLNRRSRNHAELRVLAEQRALPADDERLFFVDEFGLIESGLADLLNVALRAVKCIVVGDCNQQSAIDDSPDQPMRTLLGYERVCFMYDNVRTKDHELLKRLSYFTTDADNAMSLATESLPICNVVRLKDYLDSSDDQRSRDDSLLPKIIVRSNERVNFVNWAIGYLLHERIRDDTLCLRYSREIRVLSTDEEPNVRTKLDDAYCDEQFLVVGLTYRVVKTKSSWPVVAGSRVVVRSIESAERVTVAIADERSSRTDDAVMTFAIEKMEVEPFQYGSCWSDSRDSRIWMFPLVMDVATSVYQIQGVTLRDSQYRSCYVDFNGMDIKAMYVTLSRFESIDQIVGVINVAR